MNALRLGLPTNSLAGRDWRALPLRPSTAAIVVSGGLLLALVAAGAPRFTLALPALVVGTTIAIASPALMIASVLLVGGFIGTIIAFVGLPVDAFSAFVLLCLWFAVIYARLSGRVGGTTLLLPALIPLLLYALISVIQLLASGSLEFAVADFRLTVWYMLAVVLLAVAPWGRMTFRRIVAAFVAVSLLVGLYALYRQITGPSLSEFLLARESVQREIFFAPVRFFGSFLSAFQLAAWCAIGLPALVAIGLAGRGTWRLAAFSAAVLYAYAIFVSEVRSGLVAAAAGVAIVLVLVLFSRAFTVQKVPVILIAVLALTIVGGAGYALVVPEANEGAERFERILSPTEDASFRQRIDRWELALDLIEERPFGYGLGTQGAVGQDENPEGRVGPINLDSAYLKVGIQQGSAVMVLFVAAQLALLAGLAHRSIRTRDRWRSALGIGACGVLVAQMILYVNGTYSEGVTALAAWILIGVGVAQFSSPARLDRPTSSRSEPHPGSG